jgi:N-acetylglucosamine malate deacetylase 1
VKLDVLAIGAHPDDVELGCGGTLALLAKQGKKVGILHLTRGERGTRGTVEERQQEAEDAAKALGAVEVGFLDCGDGAFRTGEAEEDALIERLRASQLIQSASFYAGLKNRHPEAGPPYRPGAVFSYMQHDSFEPSFIVDVSSVWETKLNALRAYRSQLYQGSEQKGAQTKVASREFWLAVEGRARHFGLMINAELGEPFWSRLPLAVGDLSTLVPGGLR